jgi:Rrf2 family protein
MLTLTKKTEYALIAACHLAHADGEVISARDMARCYEARLPLLMNILKRLNKCGLLRSVRGARGGYMLTVPPREITLARLIEAVEGTPRLVKCVAPRPGDSPCELSASCPVRPTMAKMNRLFAAFLNGVTVADVAFDESFRGRRRRDLHKAGV